MKSIRQILIGMGMIGVSLFAGGGCTEGEEITGGSDTCNDLVPLMVRATASGFQVLGQDGQPLDAPLTRTPTENGNITAFNTGDAIGIFAVRNGDIVDEINNVRLVYTQTADGTYRWKPEAETNKGGTLYYYEGTGYVAYYPYKSGVTADASVTKTEAGIKSWLTAHADLQPVPDQSDADKYTACDLMIAGGTPTAGSNPSEKILTLDFKHQFAQLVMIPKIVIACRAPADGGFTYRSGAKGGIVDENANTVTLNGVTVVFVPL
ncbi:MAG: fimbrillin family protein [Bacteroides sp.]|nr:fimbrillin family protein [Bacteroides sp.]